MIRNNSCLQYNTYYIVTTFGLRAVCHLVCDVLSRLCEWYILIDKVRTGTVGEDRQSNKKNTHYGKDVYSSKLVSLIVSNMFDNDLTSFEKLLKYCVKDIKFMIVIYELNDIHVINRLLYAMYHDLLCVDMKNDKDLLFPSLMKFFKFWCLLALLYTILFLHNFCDHPFY